MSEESKGIRDSKQAQGLRQQELADQFPFELFEVDRGNLQLGLTGSWNFRDVNGPPGPPGPAGINTWGSITGTLSTQTDLQNALNAKEPTISPKRTAFNKNFGSLAGEVVEGNDPRFTNPTVDSIRFNTAASVPAPSVGQVFWDDEAKTLAIRTSIDTTLQVGQEQVIRVHNATGAILTNGTPVFISGSSSGIPEVSAADALSMMAPRTIAVLTQNILDGAEGFATTFGIIHGMDTSGLAAHDPVYLDATGGLTSTKPSYPNSAIQIGTCLTSDVNGDMHVSINNETFQKGFDVMRQPLGIVNKAQSTLTYDYATRTMTITPVGDYFAYFNRGIEYRVQTPLTLVHANTTGGHFFYISGDSNAITQSMAAWDLIKDVPLMYVYFNAETGIGAAFEERHGATRNPEWHRGQHFNVGTYYVRGLAATGFTVLSAVDANVQFGVDTGVIRDEDISSTLTAQVDGGTYTIARRQGADGHWRLSTSDMPFPYGTYAQYNQNTGTTWQLTDITNGEFYNLYVVGTPALATDRQLLMVPGQVKYSTLGAATAAKFSEDVRWGTLPLQEFAVLHRFTLRGGSSYTTKGKVRIESYEDSRGSTNRVQVSIGAASSMHNSLGGLNTGDFMHLTAEEFVLGREPRGPALTYTAGVLTGIVYDDGSTKTFSYTGGLLTTLVFVRGGKTSTKTFNYTAGVLNSIDEVII